MCLIVNRCRQRLVVLLTVNTTSSAYDEAHGNWCFQQFTIKHMGLTIKHIAKFASDLLLSLL